MSVQSLKRDFTNSFPLQDQGEREAVFFKLLIEKYSFSRLDYLSGKVLDSESLQALSKDLELLKEDVPVQHLIGELQFAGLSLKVDGRALIPRPETEELVEICLLESIKFKRALDFATGSACIALALKGKFEEVFAIEKSKAALSLAQENSTRTNRAVQFIEDDILSPQKDWPKDLDLIVSNPPYIRELERKEMSSNVLDHEPAMALFISDENPLVFYQAIAKYAAQALKPGGLLAFEINQYLGAELKAMLAQDFGEVRILKDQFGVDRFAIARSV